MAPKLIPLLLLMVGVAFAEGPLRVEFKRVEKTTAQCTVTFEYPEVISAASPAARDRINAGILRVLLRLSDWPGRDSGLRSLDAYADAFLQSCTEFQKRPEARFLYEHKRVTVFRSTPPVLSFRCDADEDGGGVHPFGTTFFVNFEAATGKPITLADLFKAGARPRVESMAETNFRREHELTAREPLSAKSFQFPKDRFRLNDNFGVGPAGLIFFFNTYEIAGGAMGPSEVKLPFRQIHDLLRFDLSQ